MFLLIELNEKKKPRGKRGFFGGEKNLLGREYYEQRSTCPMRNLVFVEILLSLQSFATVVP